MHIKCCLILKKGNFMTNMDNKAYKMVVHQDLEALEIFSISLVVAEEEEIQVLKKVKSN